MPPKSIPKDSVTIFPPMPRCSSAIARRKHGSKRLSRTGRTCATPSRAAAARSGRSARARQDRRRPRSRGGRRHGSHHRLGRGSVPAARPTHNGAKLPPRRQTNVAAGVESARGPRLEQFPSPRSPSEQEVLLTQYAERFPAEARLVAQQQDKFQQEIQQAEQAMKDASPDSE